MNQPMFFLAYGALIGMYLTVVALMGAEMVSDRRTARARTKTDPTA